jgi:hypothetical protein
MLITLSCRPAICQSVAEVYLTGVAPLGAVSHRFNFNIYFTKANWIDHILTRNCLRHGGIEGQITEVKGVGKRRTHIFDDLRNKTILGAKREC